MKLSYSTRHIPEKSILDEKVRQNRSLVSILLLSLFNGHKIIGIILLNNVNGDPFQETINFHTVPVIVLQIIFRPFYDIEQKKKKSKSTV